MKKIMMTAFAALFAVTAMAQPVNTNWYTAAIAANPSASSFTVSTAGDLAGFAAIVNGTWGGESDNFANKTVRLDRPVDLAEYENWMPIGYAPRVFSGTFNGGGHIISNLTINRIDANQGFFGLLNGGNVDSLRLVNVNINTGGAGYVGCIAGNIFNKSRITNSFSTGTVKGGLELGGLVGSMSGGSSVVNSYFNGTVAGINSTVGGIAGIVRNGSFTNCYSAGEVKSENNYDRIGGIVGFGDTVSIINCHSTSVIIGSGYIGGLAGWFSNSSIINSAALNPEVKSTTGVHTGRVAGYYNNCTFSNNFAYSGMKDNDGNISWTNKNDAGGRNGKDIGSDAFPITRDVGGLFIGDEWKTDSVALPGLFGSTTAMPAHLLTTVNNAEIPAVFTQFTQSAPIIVTVGSAYRISVTASVSDGGEFSYQWYRSTGLIGLGDTEIPGATDSFYTIPTSDVGTYYYFAVVTNTNSKLNGAKTASAVSNIIMVIVIPAQVEVQPRELTIVLRDSYGDGWNGNSLRISVNGVNRSPNPTITSGSSGTRTFNANPGDVVDVYWVRGSGTTWPQENAFAVYYTDDPPSTAFNPAWGAANNDAGALLVHRQYTSLANTTTGTLLGSFTVTAAGPRVAVSPQNIPLPAGGTHTFTASVRNINSSNGTVTWSRTGNNHSGTTINANGVLTISANETANTLTVTATSNANTAVSGSAAVNVIQPYRIGTAAELAAFADSIRDGRNFTGRVVVLTADIDLAVYGASNTAFNGGMGWRPIGTASAPFRGEFNGNGHVIRNLYINSAFLDYAGLFGQIGSANATGTVKNVGLQNVNITARNYVGGVVGLVRGYGTNVGAGNQIDYISDVTNCYVTGSVRGTTYVGGIAGSGAGWGHIKHCYSTAEVNGSSAGTTYTGGIAGYTDGDIVNCAALNPSVKGGTTAVGRIVGFRTVYATLTNNAAYDEMLNRAETFVWSNKGLAAISGADISASGINTDSTVGGRFANAPWVTAKGFLPAFGTPAAIPGYMSSEPAAVTVVTISPSGTAVQRGRVQTAQFSAVVEGTGRPSQSVIWSVSGGGAGTSISAGGLLTVFASETAAALTVTAVSVLDPAKSGTATVAFLEAADMSSPVAYHGRLSVKGNRIYNQHGDTVQLRGMSFFWSMAGEGREYYNADVVNWLADDWKVNVVRAAMGVDEVWQDRTVSPPDNMAGYLSGDNSGGVSNKKRLTDVVDAAIARGIYVIIDWHSHMAHLNRSSAITFFQEMANRYKDVPNVIYEIYNEPCAPSGGEYCGGNSWVNDIKPYSQAVVNAIRAIDPHNIIIVGTPTWSQDVDAATANPVVGENLVYSLHFYAASHGASLRSQAMAALNRGHAVFVSEFGTCRADGAGSVDIAATDVWLNFLDQHKISWVNWSIANKVEAASALRPGTSKDGNWTADDLTVSGTYIRNRLIKAAEAEFFAAPRVLSYSAGTGGKIDGYAAQIIKPGASSSEVYAAPDDGYEFVSWSDGSTQNPRRDRIVLRDVTVNAIFAVITPDDPNSIVSKDRTPPQLQPDMGESIVTAVSANELTAGPNPAIRQSGTISLFWQGSGIRSANLSVYDAAGNVVSKIAVSDRWGVARNAPTGDFAGAESRRLVGSWDLTDIKGRKISEGAYLIKGAVVTLDGKRERISLMIGVK